MDARHWVFALLLHPILLQAQVMDTPIMANALVDRLEYQSQEGADVLLWDAEGWVGGDYHKLWFKSEGDMARGHTEEAEIQALYARAIAPFWNLQMGVRHDIQPSPSRTFAVLGIEGLAPLWFEVDAASFVSTDGDVSFRLEAEYDLLLTQRLILQPRIETNLAIQDAHKWGIGEGMNDIDLGLRLRYEIRREFAPYIGVSWQRKIGETATLARDEGENLDAVSFVTGLRLWF
jgi:copper resistance protein B